MTVTLTEPTESDTMPDESQFKALLSTQLTTVKDRNMFTGQEVTDILLDLWNALNADHAPEPEPELATTG